MESTKHGENLNSSEAGPTEAETSRRLGFLKGQITVPDDFATMMAVETEEMFYGDQDELSDLSDEASPENELKAQA